MDREKAEVEVKADLSKGEMEIKIYGSKELIGELLAELKDSQERGEVEIKKLEIQN
ncbi:MAG: hypothetical protein JHC30_05505 [Caldisericum sp.]|jgi:hypothetical protein|nr:hypothetical protein [Caldisericum sp.]